MGTFSDFKCKCGYEAHGRWGIGMNPIYREQKICLAPALCKDCRELVNINENAVLPKCPECNGLNVKLYSDPSLGQFRRKSVIKSRPVYTGQPLRTIQKQAMRFKRICRTMTTMIMDWASSTQMMTSLRWKTTSMVSTRPIIFAPSVIDSRWKNRDAGFLTDGSYR